MKPFSHFTSSHVTSFFGVLGFQKQRNKHSRLLGKRAKATVIFSKQKTKISRTRENNTVGGGRRREKEEEEEAVSSHM